MKKSLLLAVKVTPVKGIPSYWSLTKVEPWLTKLDLVLFSFLDLPFRSIISSFWPLKPPHTQTREGG